MHMNAFKQDLQQRAQLLKSLTVSEPGEATPEAVSHHLRQNSSTDLISNSLNMVATALQRNMHDNTKIIKQSVLSSKGLSTDNSRSGSQIGRRRLVEELPQESTF